MNSDLEKDDEDANEFIDDLLEYISIVCLFYVTYLVLYLSTK